MIRFKFKVIKKKDVLLLDNNYAKLKFNNISYEVVDLNNINLFCIKNIFKNLIRYSFKIPFKDIYLKSLIETYSPKIVIDHNIRGYAFRVKKLCSKIFTIIYQHSFFYENEKEFYIKKFNGLSCDLFITYNQIDQDFLSKLISSKYLNLGSVKNNELILNDYKNKQIPLLIISEYRRNINDLHLKKQIELFSYIKNFAKKNKLKPFIALAANRDDKKKMLSSELDFFKKHLGEFEWSYENNFISASKSNLIICLTSNMGIELLSRGFKTIFFNLIGDEDTLQINPYLNKNSPDYFFKKLSPEEIDKRIDYYFKLSIDDWQKSSFFKNNSIFYDKENETLKREIRKIIKPNEKN